MSATESSRALLVMAAKDLRAMAALLDPESVDDEIFGFHGQQAVEKALKAWVAAIGGSYGRTHDLSQLFVLLADLGCDVTEFEELDILNPFAVVFRYEALDFDEPRIDREACIAQVKRLYDHVVKVVNLLAETGL